MKIILGSGSTSRKRVLTEMGIPFDVLTADIDEKAIRDPDPSALVLKLAQAKAQAILPKIGEPAILITADQVVVSNGAICEKPQDADEARKFFSQYPSHPPECINGLCVTNTATGKSVSASDCTRILFRPIPDDVVEAWINEGRIFKAAGGFYAEAPEFAPYVVSIDGPPDSCSGLPKELLRSLIEQVK